MRSLHYWPPNKTKTYLALLRFSRLSTPETNKTDSKAILAAINSLPTSNLPTRPLIPLIYHEAQSANLFDYLNKETQLFLKQSTLMLVGKELANQQWMKAAIEVFDRHDIPIILLKGAAFANNLYPPDAPRPGVDLDFLVKRRDFDKACGLLNETMDPVFMAEDRLATHDTLFERMYVPRNRSTPVIEIHRGLTNPDIFNIDEEILWSASQEHPAYNNRNVRLLCPEHALLHLAVHAFRDMDFCNHNLLDTHELISQKVINGEELLDSASEWGARAALYYLLLNSCSVLDTPIEIQLISDLKPNRLRRWIQIKLLKSVTLQSNDKTTTYRLVQLACQLVFPDRITAGIKFQNQYLSTRFRDLFFR